MKRDELLKLLIKLPPKADVVVDIGRAEIDIADIAGVNCRADQDIVALTLNPADLRDAFAAHLAAERSSVTKSAS